MNRAPSVRLLNLLLAGLLLGLGSACGGGGASPNAAPVPAPTPVAPPSALAFAVNPAVYTLGQVIATNPSSHGGDPVTSYSVVPALPVGLVLDATLGTVTGTPTVLAPLTSYVVTASNSGGSTTATLALTVNDRPPTSLAYGYDLAVCTVGTPLAADAPTTSGGAVVSYAVSPTLPAGLSLNPGSGVLSGTPTSASVRTLYTVTATNSGGAATTVLTLTVNDQAPSGLSYATNPAIYNVGTAIVPNMPTHVGGSVAQYTVIPTLPAGLSLDPGTGLLSGTPTVRSLKAAYTVTASNSGGSTAMVLSITVNPIPRFALVANPGDNTLSTYTVNPATGQLRHCGYMGTNAGPQAVAIHPGGTYAYIACGASGTVDYYSINPSGSLYYNQSMASGTNPYALALDPTGRFAFVANFGSNDVSAFTIEPSNGFMAAAGQFAAGAQPLSVTVDPTGRFVYVACNDSKIYAYSIHPTYGALTAVAGSPFATAGTGGVRSVTVDPSGRFVFTANVAGSLSAYSLNPSTGALTAVAGSPFAAGALPISVTVDPSSRFAYVANYTSNNVSAFAIDGTSGALSSLGTSPAGTHPQSAQVDASGRFLYVANTGSNDLSTYSIHPVTGALTALTTVSGRGGTSLALANGASPLTYVPTFAYVANTNGGNTTGSVSAFGINAGTGALSALSGSPFASGWNTQSLALGLSPFHPDYGPYLYVANYNPTLSGFKVAADGRLTQLSGFPYAAPTGQYASASVVDPTGRFVYFANYNNAGPGSVTGYRLDALDGHLVPMPGSPFAAGNGTTALTIDPSGRFVYAVNAYSNSVSAYVIDPLVGGLTRLDADAATSGVQDFATGPSPYRVAAHPSGGFLYVTNDNNSTVTIFAIATTTGALTRLDADASLAGVQDFPVSRASAVAIHPSGRYIYFTQIGGLNRVVAYTIDGATGLMTATGDVQATGANPVAMTIEASGSYAYVTNGAGNSVSVYRIDPATGALTAVVGSPFSITGATSPAAVITHGTVQ